MRWLLLALAAVLAASAQVQAQGQVQTPAPGPAPGPPRIVGGAGAGCIAGAVELPPTGPGFETIRMSRSTFWGHPNTVAGLQLLAARARAAPASIAPARGEAPPCRSAWSRVARTNAAI